MKALFKKEIRYFFTSSIGYVVIAAFLLFNNLFLWILSGDYNIFESGFASLQPFFLLSAWIFVFLTPALTMRIISEEKRSGMLPLALYLSYFYLEDCTCQIPFCTFFHLRPVTFFRYLCIYGMAIRHAQRQYGYGQYDRVLYSPFLIRSYFCGRGDAILCPKPKPDYCFCNCYFS